MVKPIGAEDLLLLADTTRRLFIEVPANIRVGSIKRTLSEREWQSYLHFKAAVDLLIVKGVIPQETLEAVLDVGWHEEDLEPEGEY
jgi:hypothetical protein